MGDEFMPRMPDPYEIEQKRLLEKANEEKKKAKVYAEDDPGIIGPPW